MSRAGEAAVSLFWESSLWRIGHWPPHRQSLPLTRVAVVEGRVGLYTQGVKELAEESLDAIPGCSPSMLIPDPVYIHSLYAVIVQLSLLTTFMAWVTRRLLVPALNAQGEDL